MCTSDFFEGNVVIRDLIKEEDIKPKNNYTLSREKKSSHD